MNDDRSNTAACDAASFPLTNETMAPSDDIARSIALVDVLSRSFDNAIKYGMASDEVSSLEFIVYDVEQSLQTLHRFISSFENQSMIEKYQAARRAQIVATRGVGGEA